MDPQTLLSQASQGLTPPSPEHVTPVGMCREQFRAMGTTISLVLPEEQYQAGKELVQTLFAHWEQTLSRFLPESELMQLNQRQGEFVPVSDLLYHVLTTALIAAEATEGVYDPALHDQLVHIGYDRSFEQLAPMPSDVSVPPLLGGGWHGIELDRFFQRVLLPAGVRLDFGGIAKGMAVDAAIEALARSGVQSAVVNAGGDLAVLGLPAWEPHWQVSVPGYGQMWSIPIRSGAVATSGIARRQWWQGSAFRHHLLDPRTGLPAETDLWSVTVATRLCEQAEVAAKVAFILGSQQGATFLEQHQIAGLLVRTDGTWQAVGSWPVHLMKEEHV